MQLRFQSNYVGWLKSWSKWHSIKMCFFIVKTYVGTGVLPPEPEQRAMLLRYMEITSGAGAPLKRI